MVSASQSRYWHNGRLYTGETLSLPLHDPGLLFGASVFTTLRVYENNLDHPWTAWQSHLERVQRSLRSFHWPMPDWAQIREGAEALAQYYPVLRVTLFPDGRELILGRPLPQNLSVLQQEGATAWVADPKTYGRSLPGHKTGNYLGCWLALQAAKQAGAEEAILVSIKGHWLETSTGNLWGWSDGQWSTPPLTAGILPGILRSRLIQGLHRYQQTVVQETWTGDRIARFTVLAYTNSVQEVIPIHTVLQGTSAVNYNPDQDKIQQLTLAWRSG